MTQGKIRVFISYSHDSKQYKDRVRQLHDKLESEGDMYVILDQDDLIGGKLQAKFMVDEPQKADKVIMLVTKKYAEKVEKGIGGAAREESIINEELARDIGREKIIPIMVGIGPEKLPSSVTGISALKFKQTKNGWDEEYPNLLRALRNVSNIVNKESSDKENLDFEMPELDEDQIKILLHLINQEDKRDFFPTEIGSGPEKIKQVATVNDLVDDGLLRFFNSDPAQNGVELNASGEFIAMRLQNENETAQYLPETGEIMNEIILEAYKDEAYRIYLELYVGCGGRVVNKLRIARNLVENDYLRSVNADWDVFELTKKGKNLAKEMTKKLNRIQLDSDKIEFQENETQNSTNERFWKVMYNGCIETDYMKIEGQIGTIYIRENNYEFEDNLVIQKDPTWSVGDASHIISHNFLPFAEEPCIIREEHTEMSLIESKIRNYYHKCNQQSVEAQEKLNYDESEHYKYAFMDHIIRACKGSRKYDPSTKEMIGRQVQIKIQNDNNPFVIPAANLVKSSGLISNFTISGNNQFTLNGLGQNSVKFGFQKALEHNEKKS